jgi:putative chitinase
MKQITETLMRKMWPHGDSKIPGLLAGIARTSAEVFLKYGINNDTILAQFFAQVSHECGAGLEMVENINYTAARACEVWPSRFKSEQDVYDKTGSFPGDPQFHIKLIDLVYGNRMGNRPGTHDGSTFIGRGLSQCTGREGYIKLGNAVHLDLINMPSLINTPQNALECGVADFILCGCLPFAQRDDVEGVTKHLNGGYIGLAQRKEWLVKWKAALAAQPVTPPITPQPVPPPIPAEKSTGLIGLIITIINAIITFIRGLKR